MANTTFTCAKCGQRTSGLKYIHEGRSYCYDCYQKLLIELKAQTDQKQGLYQYIKELYGVQEIPMDVLNMLDHELDSGRKVKGIEYTLHYYHNVLGNAIVGVNKIFYIIKDYYEAAKQYVIKMQKLQKTNSEVNIRVKPITIRIDAKKLKTKSKRNQITYKIEDL